MIVSSRLSKSQRTKGAAYEREVAEKLTRIFTRKVKVRRQLGQARDSGADIHLDCLLIECKRRKSLKTLYKWMSQVVRAKVLKASQPMLIVRADNEEDLVIFRLQDILWFAHAVGLADTVTERRSTDT